MPANAFNASTGDLLDMLLFLLKPAIPLVIFSVAKKETNSIIVFLFRAA